MLGLGGGFVVVLHRAAVLNGAVSQLIPTPQKTAHRVTFCHGSPRWALRGAHELRFCEEATLYRKGGGS